MQSVERYIYFLRESALVATVADAVEKARREKLAREFLSIHPARRSMLTKVIEEQIYRAYQNAYNQCIKDLLAPNQEPGQPATAYLLLNKIGELVLKNRAELLQVALPRPQCPGCFTLIPEFTEIGWCKGCEPHKAQLMAQVAHLLPQTK